MTTKPVMLLANNETEIAVFLMDTQGIQNGDQMKCKEGDIFTISLTLSYMQIINVMDRTKYMDLDTYAALTLYGKLVSGLPTNQKKLTVLFRDWIYKSLHPFGCEGGNAYYQTLSDDDELKIQLQCIKKFFKSVDCFLMPFPGIKIEREDSKQRTDLNQEAWLNILALKSNLFSTANIQEAFDTLPKGKELLRLAKNLQVTFSENSLAAPESSFRKFYKLKVMSEISNCSQIYTENMEKFTQETGNDFKKRHEDVKLNLSETFTDNGSIDDMTPYVEMLDQQIEKEYEVLYKAVMEAQRNECLEFYKKLMQDFTDFKGKALKEKHTEKTEKAVVQLMNQNPIREDSVEVEEFRSQTYAQCEIYVGRQMSKDFAQKWEKDIRNKGKFKEGEVRTYFTEEGKKFLEKFRAEINDQRSLSLVIGEFIETLNSKFHKEIKRRRNNKTKAIGVAATFGGLIVGGLFVFVPPLGAAATASYIATELALGLISGGIGVMGAAVTGGVAVGVSSQVHKSQVIPPNLQGDNDASRNEEMQCVHGNNQCEPEAPEFDAGNPSDSNSSEDGWEDNQPAGENDPLLKNENTEDPLVVDIQNTVNRVVRLCKYPE